MTDTPRILIIVQARMASTRFSGKIFALLAGQSMLLRQLDSLSIVKTPHDLVVASPSTDSEIQTLCHRHGYECELVDGDPNDVLSRFITVARNYHPDHIVRLTGDCPLIDSATVDAIIAHHMRNNASHTGIALEWGDGNDVEIMTYDALLLANMNAKLPSEREHVTPYLYKKPHDYKLVTRTFPCPLDASWLRYSVDTPEDLCIAEYIYDRLVGRIGQSFGWRDILHLAQRDDYVRRHMMGRAHNPAYVAQVAQETGVDAQTIRWDRMRYGTVDMTRGETAPQGGCAIEEKS